MGKIFKKEISFPIHLMHNRSYDVPLSICSPRFLGVYEQKFEVFVFIHFCVLICAYMWAKCRADFIIFFYFLKGLKGIQGSFVKSSLGRFRSVKSWRLNNSALGIIGKIKGLWMTCWNEAIKHFFTVGTRDSPLRLLEGPPCVFTHFMGMVVR